MEHNDEKDLETQRKNNGTQDTFGSIQSSEERKKQPKLENVKDGDSSMLSVQDEESTDENMSVSDLTSTSLNGSTKSPQEQYEVVRNEVERMAEKLNLRALTTMMQQLQLDDPRNLSALYSCNSPNPESGQRLSSSALSIMENKIKELEKESVKIGRRIKERSRELAYTVQKVEALEMKVIQEEGKDFIRGLISKIPTTKDLKNIKDITQLMYEQRESISRIQCLEMQFSALNKAMAAGASSPQNAQFQEQWKPLVDPVSHSSILYVSKGKSLPDFGKMTLSEKDAFIADKFESGSIQMKVDTDGKSKHLDGTKFDDLPINKQEGSTEDRMVVQMSSKDETEDSQSNRSADDLLDKST